MTFVAGQVRLGGRRPAQRPNDDEPAGPMSDVIAISLASLWAALALVQAKPPGDAMIVQMAQHLVQERFMFGDLGHYHIEFDVAYLYPQPRPNYWAVVGGFVSDQTDRNTYVAAVSLICPDAQDVNCWRLEKLAINGTVVLDQGQPL
jgi:hypothetical protein